MPVYFNFVATGGDGVYDWTDKQQYSEIGSIIFSSNQTIPVPVNVSDTETLTNYGTANSTIPATGSSPKASFYDAPGQPSVDPNFGKTISAVLNFTFTLNVQVDGVSCQSGPVSWTATLQWPRRKKPSGRDFVPKP